MTPILPTLLVLYQKVRGKHLSAGEAERRDPLFNHQEELEAKKLEDGDHKMENGNGLLRH